MTYDWIGVRFFRQIFRTFSHGKRQVQDMSFFAFDEEKDRRRAPWRYDAAGNEDTDVDQEKDSEEEALNPDDEEEKKAPVAVRVLVWAAVVMIFFAIGYWGSGLVINWLDRRGVIRDEQLVQGTDEVRQLTAQEEGKTDTAVGHRSRFRIYIPTSGSFREETVSFVSGLLEDDLKNVLSGLLETYRKEGLFSGEIRVLHVFRNGDRLYLDLNDPFLENISRMPEEKAVSVITGIVSTVATNFSPITRVRFLINGREVNGTKPVDLSSFWAMPS